MNIYTTAGLFLHKYIYFFYLPLKQKTIFHSEIICGIQSRLCSLVVATLDWLSRKQQSLFKILLLTHILCVKQILYSYLPQIFDQIEPPLHLYLVLNHHLCNGGMSQEHASL